MTPLRITMSLDVSGLRLYVGMIWWEGRRKFRITYIGKHGHTSLRCGEDSLSVAHMRIERIRQVTFVEQT